MFGGGIVLRVMRGQVVLRELPEEPSAIVWTPQPGQRSVRTGFDWREYARMMSGAGDTSIVSDKYPMVPRGLVPLKTSDKSAQDLLWTYAQRRREVDADFSADLETALRNQGYEPRPEPDPRALLAEAKAALEACAGYLDRVESDDADPYADRARAAAKAIGEALNK